MVRRTCCGPVTGLLAGRGTIFVTPAAQKGFSRARACFVRHRAMLTRKHVVRVGKVVSGMHHA